MLGATAAYSLPLPFFLRPPASFTIKCNVETLLNCLWLVLSLSLVTVWLAHGVRRQPSRAEAILPSRRLQFTAIIVLVLLLFPVISLTDDLAMCAATRDTEQTLRLHELCDGSHPQPAMLPSALAWMDTIHFLLSTATHRTLEQDAQLLTLQEGARFPVDSRPPPATL